LILNEVCNFKDFYAQINCALIGPASPCKDCPGCFPWDVKPVSDVSPIKQFFLLLVEWLEGI
jgi:hypothetical protein